MEYTDKLLGEKKMQVKDYDEHLASRERESQSMHHDMQKLTHGHGENTSGALNPKVGGY